MLGYKKTNLERLQYMVFDDACLLVERFYKQVYTLIQCYTELLKLRASLSQAQFIVFSSLWSTNLKRFLERYLPSMAMLTDNKLEASYFGQTHHVIDECDKESKLKKVLQILKTCVSEDKNTVIFVENDDTATFIRDILADRLNFANVSLLTEQTTNAKITELENKWTTWHQIDKSHLKNKQLNTNLTLICTDKTARFVDINNAKCIIHHEFPSKFYAALFLNEYFSID